MSCSIQNFFSDVIDNDILSKSLHILSKLNNSDARALKSDLRRNEELRDNLNNRKISLDEIMSLPPERRATRAVQEKRNREKEKCLKCVIHEIKQVSKEEIEILSNHIEDP